MRKRWWLIPLGFAAVGFGAYKLTRPLSVSVVAVIRGIAVDAVYATGTVEAEDRVDVKAKTSGSIAELLVREGNQVKKGDLLARIDNPVVSFELKRGEIEAKAASAQAGSKGPQLQMLQAQANAVQVELAIARKDLERLDELVKRGAVAEAEVDRARSRVQQLEANLAANDAQQRAQRIDLGANAARMAASLQSLASRVNDTEVRAPMDGVVLIRRVEPGEVVAVNQPLFRVGDTRRLILEVAVDEADVSRIHDGRDGSPPSAAAVSLLAFGATIFRGKVFEILPDANRERKAFLAKVRLDAPPAGLRSGMTAEVNVIAQEKPGVLLVPTDALQEDKVWVVQGEKLEHREVKVGLRDLLKVEVVDGLKEGERVVLTRSEKLAEGKRVLATEKPADLLGAR